MRRTGRTATVTVKVDTGLSRNGVGAADYPAVLAALRRAEADDTVRVHGIMSHLVHGDDPDHPLNDLQAQRLTDMVATARDHGLAVDVVHLSNSPAVLTRPDLAFDMVRPGIAVYGLSPLPERGDLGLRPAMTVKCPVVMVRSLKAGDGVSYGHTWITESDTTVALVPAGYADGVFRTLSDRIEVSINGRRYPGVGRICMDQFVVDLGPGRTDVAVGDDAILFGPAPTANRLRRTGRRCWAPSTMRWSRARAAASCRTYRRGRIPLKRRCGMAGRCGGGVCRRYRCGSVAGPVAASPGHREDPHCDEDFELLDADRSCVVTTPDGVPLAVREVGPEDAPLTVVFAHGFCLRMGSFHFQRARLTEEWGPQVRMVFYDQRGHGQSGEASPDTYTVEQLGQDLESVLAVMVPRGPVVLVGHSMGGMTVLSHAQAVPAAVSDPHRRCRVDLHCRRRRFTISVGRGPEEPGIGSRAPGRAVCPEVRAPGPRRCALGDRPDPAGGVLRRREGQPQRGGVLRADDA